MEFSQWKQAEMPSVKTFERDGYRVWRGFLSRSRTQKPANVIVMFVAKGQAIATMTKLRALDCLMKHTPTSTVPLAGVGKGCPAKALTCF